uniref:Uncharacterized protein n=1 Tax=Octopus bimaculoides TaxID=37653 RepID=A0A0L8H0T0_OCTBM
MWSHFDPSGVPSPIFLYLIWPWYAECVKKSYPHILHFLHVACYKKNNFTYFYFYLFFNF